MVPLAALCLVVELAVFHSNVVPGLGRGIIRALVAGLASGRARRIV